ncbi:phage tail tape measure protein [Tenacibaculum soleae]|uniref:hypothetical protein n=1 Tax=Tenacibaculum soleae TaxID=447689 RepID=UPI002300B5EC|nr:hypothetical protein [Tenacibaculum soleae]
MAGKIHDEQLKLDIVINGNDAQKKLGDLQQAKRNLKKESDDLRKAKTALIAAGKKETEEFNQLEKQLKQNNKTLNETRESEKKLTKEIGVAGLTTNQLYSEKKRLKRLMKSFTPNSKQWTEYAGELAKVDKRLDEVNDEFNEVKKTLNDDQAFSAAQESFSNIITGIKTGDLTALKAGFKGLSGGIKTAAKSAIAFIATPLGATLAILAATIGAGKMWFDYNVALSKTLKLTEQLTDLQGQDLSDYRAQVQGLADTFDQEYNEVLRASNALAKQMKISQTDALDLVQQGFVRGANANGDFLDKLKEYPVHFKNAGYTAQDFIDVATQEATGGVFNDKLVDTIKEIDLSLREMDKTQIDVLETNFGKKYAKELSDGIKSGETTTKQAFESIIKKSNDMGLNIQQQQKIVADIMKSAGEDAGGYAEVIKQLNAAFNEQNKTLSENETATERLTQANQESEKAMADLFDASKSGFPAMLTNLKAIGKEIFTNVLRGFHNMITSQEQLNATAGLEGQSKAVRDISENMKIYGSTAQKEVDAQINTAVKNIARIKGELDNVGAVSSFFGGKSAYEQNLAEAQAYYDELLKIKTGNSKKFTEHQSEYKEVDVSEKSKSNNTPNAAEIAAKQKAYKKAEEELAAFMLSQKQQQLLNEKFGLEKELAQIDAKYQKEIEKAQKHHLNTAELEGVRDAEKKELTLLRQQELNERLKTQEEENYLEEEALRLEREALAAETEEEKTLLLLERTQWIANEQLRIEEEKELARLKLAGATEEEIALIKKKFATKKAKVEDVFNKGKEKADKQTKKNETVINQQRVQEYSDMFGNIATLLGKNTAAGKAAAIAQATMNTYQGVSEVWSSKSTLPEPFATASKIISTGVVLGSGMAAVKNITATKVPGYEDGLYPVTRNDGKKFNAKLGTTKTGLVNGPTLMDGKYLAGERSTASNPEMIIDDVTFSKLDPNVISYITNVHNGTVSGYETGKYNQSATAETVSFNKEEGTTTDASLSTEAIELLRRIADASEKGTTLVFGYEDAQKVFDLQNETNLSNQNGKFK